MADDAPSDAPPPDPSPFIMEDCLHRLRLLNYEAAYCAPRDLPPFHKYQFAVPSAAPATQFPAFVGILSWLLSEAKRKFAVERLDDPATITTRLLNELRAMGAPSEVVDVSPVKLRSACGEAPCRILLFCSEAALAAKGFKWGKPAYPEDPPQQDLEEEMDPEEDGGVEEELAEGSDGEGGAVVGSGAGGRGGGGGGGGGGSATARAAVLAPTVDAATWRAEVERVAPRLRAPVRGGGGGGSLLLGGALRGGGGGGGGGLGALGAGGGGGTLGEWRAHFESARAAAASVGALAAPSVALLRTLGEELSEALTVAGAREAALSKSHAPLVAERGAAAEAGAALSGAVAGAQGRVAGLSAELAAVAEALEEVSGAIEDRGASMTDASALLKVKAALSGVRADVRAQDVQLGVIGHAVMQRRLHAGTAAVGRP